MIPSPHQAPCAPLSTLTRHPHWPSAFAGFLAAWQRTPFAWGSADCGGFAEAAVDAIAGPYRLRERWASEGGALRLIARHGGFAAAADWLFGAGVADWRSARRGDVVLVEKDGVPGLAVCAGDTVCGPGLRELEHLPLERAIRVWRVG